MTYHKEHGPEIGSKSDDRETEGMRTTELTSESLRTHSSDVFKADFIRYCEAEPRPHPVVEITEALRAAHDVDFLTEVHDMDHSLLNDTDRDAFHSI